MHHRKSRDNTLTFRIPQAYLNHIEHFVALNGDGAPRQQ
jgi:hypothetical protein